MLTRAAMAVAGNGIGDLGAAALAEGMKESGSLTELRLGGACGRARAVGPRGGGAPRELAWSLGSAYAGCAAHAGNRIGDFGATALAAGLYSSRTLTALWLGGAWQPGALDRARVGGLTCTY